MKNYLVVLPIAGIVTCNVEAESEEQAIELAMDREWNVSDIESWDVHKQLVRGNMCCAETTEAYAEED